MSQPPSPPGAASVSPRNQDAGRRVPLVATRNHLHDQPCKKRQRRGYRGGRAQTANRQEILGSFENRSRASHDTHYVGCKKWGLAPTRIILFITEERTSMNAETVFPTPPATEGTLPPPPEAPITEEKPV